MTTDAFTFHFKSASAPPGKGIHEHADPTAYSTLKNSPLWRRALSDYWESPFTYSDGHRYNTVTHLMQAKKLTLSSRNHGIPFEMCSGFIFSIDSGHPFSTMPGSFINTIEYADLFNDFELEEWNSIKDEIREEALFAKFSQYAALRIVLLATGDAQLWNQQGPFFAAKRPHRDFQLERVRRVLLQANSSFTPYEGQSDSE